MNKTLRQRKFKSNRHAIAALRQQGWKHWNSYPGGIHVFYHDKLNHKIQVCGGKTTTF